MKKLHSTLVAVSISLAMALTLPSCSNGGGGGDGGDPSSSSGNALLLNFTSDYTDGVLRWMNTADTALDAGELTGFDQDSKVFAHNGKIFILERPTDTTVTPWRTDGRLNCLSPATGQPVSYGSVPLATGSNPYDIAFIGNTGYIAQYGIDSVQIFDATNCQLNGRIGLPSTIPVQYSSSSVVATANAASIKTDGTKLYVVMQTWKSYPDTATNGALVRINLTSGYPRDSMLLNYYNPQSSILNNGNLYIASAWDLTAPPYGFGIIPAVSGVEVVNSVAGTSPQSTPFVSGTTLNGGVTRACSH